MKLLTLIIIILIILFSCPITHAESDWTFTFFGINSRDFKDRKPLVVITGGIASFVVHELGHLMASKMVGAYGHLERYHGMPSTHTYYDEHHNDDQKAFVSSAGFLADMIVGSAIVAIPQTRYSDFTVGFNATTMAENLIYPIRSNNSPSDREDDIKNLDKFGYNGDLIAVTSGIYAGVLTYISLNKEE